MPRARRTGSTTGSTARSCRAPPAASGPVYNPATGEQSAEVDFASRRGGRRRGRGGARRRSRRGARRRCRGAPRSCSACASLVDAHRKEIASLLTAEHGKVLADALGRGRPRPREHRVRLRHPAPDEGRLQRAGQHRRRRLLDPPAARRGRRHHAVQLPGDGADVDVRQRPRLRQHVRPQAEREGPVGVAVPRRAAQARPGCPTACFNVVQGDKVAVDRLLEHPDIAAVSFVGSTPIAALHLRDRHGERQARAGARRRQEPHARAARRRPRHGRRRRRVSAAYGSAGERCMAISVVVAVGDVADALVDAIAERIPKIKVGPGNEPEQRDGPADHRRAPRQGRRLPRQRRRARARPSSSTAGSTCSPARRRLLPRRLAARRRRARHGRATTTRSSARCSRSCASHDYEEALALDQRQPVRQRHGDLHPRRRRRPPVPVRRPGRHGRRQRADPGAGDLLQLRRLEGVAVRRHRTCTARRASTSTPAARSSPAAGPIRPRQRSTSASRGRADRLLA